MRRTWVVALLVGLVACAADADGDGLTNREEKDLGLDPEQADSDGDGLDDGEEAGFGADPLVSDTDEDGLSDGDEIAAGADPTAADTDGDGYLDFDEVAEGHDPADPKDRIYKGNWPYYRDKDELGDRRPTGDAVEEGEKFFHMDEGTDQFGDKFDLYDFAGRGLVVIDASATWCGPCQAMSSWISSGGERDPLGVEATYGDVRAAIDSGEVGWVTFMTDGASGPATIPEVKRWDELYPHEKIPVVTDPNSSVLMGVNYDPPYLLWPQFVVLNAKMKVVYRGSYNGMLQYVAGEL